MFLNQFLLLAAILFCIGVYGVLARKNGVLVLMSIELILNAVNINLVAFGAYWHVNDMANVTGQVFALFVIAVAAAEVGNGSAAGVVEGVEVHPQVTRRRYLHIPPIERRAVDGDADDGGREGGEDVLLRGGGETESIQPRRR